MIMQRFTILFSTIAALALSPLLGDGFCREGSDFYCGQPGFTWTGFYSGVHGGYDWGSVKYSFLPGASGGNDIFPTFAPFSTGGEFKQHPSGGDFGGHLGYNQQWGCYSFGLETSIDTTGVQVKTRNEFGSDPEFRASYRTTLQWYATITPRVGYIYQDWLFYFKAGLAAGRFRSRLNSDHSINFEGDADAGPATFSQTNDHIGSVFGLGLEYAVYCGWILGLEYNFMSFSGKQYGGARIPNTEWALEYKVRPENISTILLRISYVFY